MSTPFEIHYDPKFVDIFGKTIGMIRKVIMSETAQPFILSGPSTLGWDMLSNVIESNDQVLVLNYGYSSSQISECLELYGARVTQICPQIGLHPSQEAIEQAVTNTRYKLIAITHVETSTGVLSDIKTIAEIVKSISPETLVVVDAICSINSEEICFDLWDLDIIITGSQKFIGVRAGLSIVIVSQKAISMSQNRKMPIASYHANWNKWLPVMQSYETGQLSCFTTSSLELIYALHTTMTKMLGEPFNARFDEQRQVVSDFRRTVRNWGLQLVPRNEAWAANEYTSIWLPKGLDIVKLVESIAKKGVQINVGSFKSSAPYFRFSHMRISVTDNERQHIMKAAENALFCSLNEMGYKFIDHCAASVSRL
ncbi:pyridoxal phosphate-dependent transferase [Mucor mucedo]|uniref:pyridoxal phosphate-dependent transferase n=1 Tax=Mucor mucedo TaxID=29922 RepID=UPI00221FD777|nr:pyridoxal phosphate-dependent transferase [Mucor mucedo]KAI7893727.1 pyridoxal phosphate-dependent transferase [Mucor mucedo]